MAFEPFQQLLRSLQGKKQARGLGDVKNLQHIAFLRNLQKETYKPDEMTIPLSQIELVVFDIETTGFCPEKGDTILSIGAVKMVGTTILEQVTFYSLLNMEKAVPTHITKLTGITSENILAAPTASDVLIQFFEFAKGSTLVAHHAHHERSFMKYASQHYFHTPFEQRIVDTSFLFKAIDPQLQLINLEDYCAYHHIPIVNRHHALGDARLTAILWSLYTQRAITMGLEHLQDVYNHFAAHK